MFQKFITLASVLAVACVASAAAPRESLPFNAVKPGGELRIRIAKNFERLHAERYQKNQLFTKSHDAKWPGEMEGRVTLGLVLDARLPEQPSDKKDSPAARPLSGALKAGEPGQPTLGETPLLPVYHLLDPTYDAIKGSWRQMLFPK